MKEVGFQQDHSSRSNQTLCMGSMGEERRSSRYYALKMAHEIKQEKGGVEISASQEGPQQSKPMVA